jgi:hypothetical protein
MVVMVAIWTIPLTKRYSQMTVMVTVFLTCWSPYALLSFATILGYAEVKILYVIIKGYSRIKKMVCSE